MRAARSARSVGGTASSPSARRVFGLQREQLLDEERVALRRLEDALAHALREGALIEERVDERVHLRLRERLEHQ